MVRFASARRDCPGVEFSVVEETEGSDELALEKVRPCGIE
jgi:hypothetical protein